MAKKKKAVKHKQEECIEIFTDGSCLKTGAGGWGALIKYPDGNRVAVSGNAKFTTAPAMEVKAVVEALKTIKEPSNIKIVLDCEYVSKGTNTWIHNWEKNDFRNWKKKLVAHDSEWRKISKMKQFHKKIKCEHVNSHCSSSPTENLIVDILAKDAALSVE